eukprot:GILJ01002791.1.p1 GENE.GILJ01002791.1~~GILJ01002791.1.p1  ORF type:complete len:955 (-),score=192.33 GILJ01002791.1:122-2941(-)
MASFFRPSSPLAADKSRLRLSSVDLDGVKSTDSRPASASLHQMQEEFFIQQFQGESDENSQSVHVNRRRLDDVRHLYDRRKEELQALEQTYRELVEKIERSDTMQHDPLSAGHPGQKIKGTSSKIKELESIVGTESERALVHRHMVSRLKHIRHENTLRLEAIQAVLTAATEQYPDVRTLLDDAKREKGYADLELKRYQQFLSASRAKQEAVLDNRRQEIEKLRSEIGKLEKDWVAREQQAKEAAYRHQLLKQKAVDCEKKFSQLRITMKFNRMAMLKYRVAFESLAERFKIREPEAIIQKYMELKTVEQSWRSRFEDLQAQCSRLQQNKKELESSLQDTKDVKTHDTVPESDQLLTMDQIRPITEARTKAERNLRRLHDAQDHILLIKGKLLHVLHKMYTVLAGPSDSSVNRSLFDSIFGLRFDPQVLQQAKAVLAEHAWFFGNQLNSQINSSSTHGNSHQSLHPGTPPSPDSAGNQQEDIHSGAGAGAEEILTMFTTMFPKQRKCAKQFVSRVCENRLFVALPPSRIQEYLNDCELQASGVEAEAAAIALEHVSDLVTEARVGSERQLVELVEVVGKAAEALRVLMDKPPAASRSNSSRLLTSHSTTSTRTTKETVNSPNQQSDSEESLLRQRVDSVLKFVSNRGVNQVMIESALSGQQKNKKLPNRRAAIKVQLGVNGQDNDEEEADERGLLKDDREELKKSSKGTEKQNAKKKGRGGSNTPGGNGYETIKTSFTDKSPTQKELSLMKDLKDLKQQKIKLKRVAVGNRSPTKTLPPAANSASSGIPLLLPHMLAPLVHSPTNLRKSPSAPALSSAGRLGSPTSTFSPDRPPLTPIHEGVVSGSLSSRLSVMSDTVSISMNSVGARSGTLEPLDELMNPANRLKKLNRLLAPNNAPSSGLTRVSQLGADAEKLLQFVNQERALSPRSLKKKLQESPV